MKTRMGLLLGAAMHLLLSNASFADTCNVAANARIDTNNGIPSDAVSCTVKSFRISGCTGTPTNATIPMSSVVTVNAPMSEPVAVPMACSQCPAANLVLTFTCTKKDGSKKDGTSGMAKRALVDGMNYDFGYLPIRLSWR